MSRPSYWDLRDLLVETKKALPEGALLDRVRATVKRSWSSCPECDSRKARDADDRAGKAEASARRNALRAAELEKERHGLRSLIAWLAETREKCACDTPADKGCPIILERDRAIEFGHKAQEQEAERAKEIAELLRGIALLRRQLNEHAGASARLYRENEALRGQLARVEDAKAAAFDAGAAKMREVCLEHVAAFVMPPEEGSACAESLRGLIPPTLHEEGGA